MPYNFVTDSFPTKKLYSRLSSSKVLFYTENGRSRSPSTLSRAEPTECPKPVGRVEQNFSWNDNSDRLDQFLGLSQTSFWTGKLPFNFGSHPDSESRSGLGIRTLDSDSVFKQDLPRRRSAL